MLQQLFKNPMALLCMGIVLVTALLGIVAALPLSPDAPANAAVRALADFAGDKLERGHIIPGAFEPGVADAVAKAVAAAARESGAARL